MLTNGYMRAIVFLEGSNTRIYLLVDNKGESEVKDFLDKNRGNKKLSGIVNGFSMYFEIASKEGTGRFTSEQVAHWKEGNDTFYEFRKGKYRISFFHYDSNRILLVTLFRKYRMKEKKQYKHAVNLKRKFDEDPRWED